MGCKRAVLLAILYLLRDLSFLCPSNTVIRKHERNRLISITGSNATSYRIEFFRLKTF